MESGPPEGIHLQSLGSVMVSYTAQGVVKLRSWKKIPGWSGWALTASTLSLKERGRGNFERDRGGHVKTRRERCGHKPHPGDTKPPEAGRGKNGFSLGLRRECRLTGTRFHTSDLPNWEKINFCFFKLPSFGPFVMAALGS